MKIDKKRKRPRAQISSDVQAIRSRYADGLAAGMSMQEAARYAHGKSEDKIVVKKITVEVKEQPTETPVQKIHVHGRPKDPVKRVTEETPEQEEEATEEQQDENTTDGTRPDIPANWQELPWPQLRALVKQFNEGINPASRKEAEEIISKQLQE